MFLSTNGWRSSAAAEGLSAALGASIAETKSTASDDRDLGNGLSLWAAIDALTAALSAPSNGRCPVRSS